MTQSIETIPIDVTKEQLENPYVINGLAQRAFRGIGYDMSPDNPVQSALDLGILRVMDTDEV